MPHCLPYHPARWANPSTTLTTIVSEPNARARTAHAITAASPNVHAILPSEERHAITALAQDVNARSAHPRSTGTERLVRHQLRQLPTAIQHQQRPVHRPSPRGSGALGALEVVPRSLHRLGWASGARCLSHGHHQPAGCVPSSTAWTSALRSRRKKIR